MQELTFTFSQEGTDQPTVAATFINTIGSFAISASGTGKFPIVSTGAFPVKEKVLLPAPTSFVNNNGDHIMVAFNWMDQNTVEVNCATVPDGNETALNYTDFPVTIKVKP